MLKVEEDARGLVGEAFGIVAVDGDEVLLEDGVLGDAVTVVGDGRTLVDNELTIGLRRGVSSRTVDVLGVSFEGAITFTALMGVKALGTPPVLVIEGVTGADVVCSVGRAISKTEASIS